MSRNDEIYREELDRFYQRSWEKRGDVLSPSRQRRIEIVNCFLKQLLPENAVKRDQLQVLDYGCGGGWFLKVLGAAGFRQLHAYDVTPSVLQATAEKYPHVTFWEGNSHFPSVLPDQTFDLLTSIEVIEHIPILQKQAYFADLYRITRPNALVILTTPNGALKRLALPPEEAQPVEDWVTLRDLQNLARSAGFTVVAAGTEGIRRYGFARDRILLSYRLRQLLVKLSLWDSYERFLGRLHLGITMYVVLQR